MYPNPVIPLAGSLFAPEDPAPDPTLTAPDWVDALGGDYLYAHVASPDAHIDKPNSRIVMYYHGLLRDCDQQTRLATSTDGLHFTLQAPLFRSALFPRHVAGRSHIFVNVGGPARPYGFMGGASRARPVHPCRVPFAAAYIGS